jgi:capsular polysaccharide biosynthesis protein
MTRAAFKFQYTVVRPAELPRVPSKPKASLIVVATIVLALLLMIGLPGALDLLRGRFIEPWQVSRNLDLPLLGELNPPS